MKRRAKRPKDKCKWWGDKSNQTVLNNILKVISYEMDVIDAFKWDSTKEKYKYWSKISEDFWFA